MRLTAPDYCYLNQAFLILRTRGRPGKILVSEIGRSQDSLYGGGGD